MVFQPGHDGDSKPVGPGTDGLWGKDNASRRLKEKKTRENWHASKKQAPGECRVRVTLGRGRICPPSTLLVKTTALRRLR